MRPPSLTIYIDREERRFVRRVALEAGLSASSLSRLAVLTVARQMEAALRQGAPPETIVERLTEQAHGTATGARQVP